jgi:hypothetical protein
MFTTTTSENRMIVTMLAAGQPVWYVAAVTNKHSHTVHQVGTSYGYPDRTKLRQAVARWATTSAAA